MQLLQGKDAGCRQLLENSLAALFYLFIFFKGFIVIISLIAWIWSFVILTVSSIGKADVHTKRELFLKRRNKLKEQSVLHILQPHPKKGNKT